MEVARKRSTKTCEIAKKKTIEEVGFLTVLNTRLFLIYKTSQK